jgi:hypothetical protein
VLGLCVCGAVLASSEGRCLVCTLGRPVQSKCTVKCSESGVSFSPYPVSNRAYQYLTIQTNGLLGETQLGQNPRQPKSSPPPKQPKPFSTLDPPNTTNKHNTTTYPLKHIITLLYWPHRAFGSCGLHSTLSIRSVK